MNMRAFWFSILLVFVADREIHPQTAVKKVRLGIQSNNIGFLPFHLAYHKGFYREQGIDLETIFMSTQAVNAAFVRGDIDYSAAINGMIQTIVRGKPAKILACAVDRPLISLIARKEIRSAQDLKGKKIGGSTPGGTATLMADTALKHLGFQSRPGRDDRASARRIGWPPWNPARSTPRFSACRKIFSPSTRGYNELLFVGDIVNFPQNAIGASVEKDPRKPRRGLWHGAGRAARVVFSF